MKNNNFSQLHQNYREKGYCILRNGISFNVINKAYEEIMDSKQTVVYKDRLQNLRRIEQIYDKGTNLRLVNQSILAYLLKIFSEEFYIFKDKYNAKPPQGEGFFAHYDGIFKWPDASDVLRDGWYYYAQTFVNVLVCIDPMTDENGALEVASEHRGEFEDLMKNTKKNGTPNIIKTMEQSIHFETITGNPGDLVFFSNRCPHRSSKNNSLLDRRTLYYTYNPQREGNHYSQYFVDKTKSRNPTIKSLSGEI